MRTSVLSRSVITIASLAIGSVALAATPATAATPSGITRDMVLQAANGVRVPGDQDYSPTTDALLQSMAVAQCGITSSQPFLGASGTPTQAGGSADGLLVFAVYADGDDLRACEFGVVAATDPAASLTGTSVLDGTNDGEVVHDVAALTGDAGATVPIKTPLDAPSPETTFTAAGAAAKATTTEVIVKVADKKTKAQTKAAKKKYAKRIAAAKKKYAKAIDKAGKSKTKKASAKRAYANRRAAAKAVYNASRAPYKLVRTIQYGTDSRPFSLTASDALS